MKVSRKVGRRKHSRCSSVSRRRLRNKKTKSGYKKKHAKTQRGGARSRKYGHKRGKRFHRGGVNCDSIYLMPLYKNRDGTSIPQSDDSITRRRYFSTATPTIYYKKIGSRFATEDDSEFTMYVDFIIMGDNVDLIIDFTRDPLDDKSPTFLFQTNGTKGVINQYLTNMADLITDSDQTESDTKYSLISGDGILTKKPYDSSGRIYSFKNQKNIETFNNIAKCIISKIDVVAAAAAAAAHALSLRPASAPAPVGIDDEI